MSFLERSVLLVRIVLTSPSPFDGIEIKSFTRPLVDDVDVQFVQMSAIVSRRDGVLVVSHVAFTLLGTQRTCDSRHELQRLIEDLDSNPSSSQARSTPPGLVCYLGRIPPSDSKLHAVKVV